MKDYVTPTIQQVGGDDVVTPQVLIFLFYALALAVQTVAAAVSYAGAVQVALVAFAWTAVVGPSEDM